MSIFEGWGSRRRALFADIKGPWGSGTGSGGKRPTGEEPSEPTRGPWGEPPKRGSGLWSRLKEALGA